MKQHETRRTFLKAAGTALAAAPLIGVPEVMAQQNRPRLKITDIRIVKHRMIKEVGTLEPAWALGSKTTFRVGGGAFLEIHTDQGLVGLGPEFNAELLPACKEYLVGKDPFETQLHYTTLRALPRSNGYNGVSCISIALWDLIGKACNQPLYKLWGGGKDRVPAYASMILMSTPEERADMAAKLMNEGWQAIKLRLHAEDMKEDLRQVELVKKAVGNRMKIMVDPNQASIRKGYVQWDYARALTMARELEKMDVFWLEEPLLRTDLDGMEKLQKETTIPLAWGENEQELSVLAGAMRRGIFEWINPEVLHLGVDNIRKVVAMGELFGVQAVPHNGNYRIGTIAHLHLIASWTNAPYIEVLHDPPIGAYQNHYAIFTNPPLVGPDGCQPVPQGPGLGIEMNPDLIEKA